MHGETTKTRYRVSMIYMTKLTLPSIYTEVSLKLLVNDLVSVRRTFDLGIQLGVPESALNDIEVDYRHSVADRRRETVSKWLNIDEQPSWSKLVRALVAMSERHVARNIAVKYGIIYSLFIAQCTCIVIISL